MKKYDTALVIGAGAFGTCIACVLAKKFSRVLLQTRNPLNKSHQTYNMHFVSDWERVNHFQKGIELIVSGLPSSAIREYFGKNSHHLIPYLKKDIPLVSVAKGIDPDTLELPDDLFFSLFKPYKNCFHFLSGPSFADEIMEEQITLVSMAGYSHDSLQRIVPMFETSYFKALACLDVKGVLLGGAIKNVLAIAGGIIEGLGFNHNTRAALITRGINEMLDFGRIFKALPETFYGLSGMGDLILSTTGGSSRNRKFGHEVAKGRRPLDILKEDKMLVEGYKTCAALNHLAKKHKIRAVICNGLHEVLYENQDPRRVIQKLMRFPITFEFN